MSILNDSYYFETVNVDWISIIILYPFISYIENGRGILNINLFWKKNDKKNSCIYYFNFTSNNYLCKNMSHIISLVQKIIEEKSVNWIKKITLLLNIIVQI